MSRRITSVLAGVLLAALTTTGARAEDPPPVGPVVPPVAPPIAPPEPPAEAPPEAVPSGPSGFEDLFPFGVRGVNPDVSKPLGGPARIQAIDAGVQWLVSHQMPTGEWDPTHLEYCDGKQGTLTLDGAGKATYPVGVTGLAVCALLGAGISDHGTSRQSRALASAILWLRSTQDGDGCFGPQVSGHFVYNHAFATLALVEAFGSSGDAGLHAAARKGLEFSESARNPGFGWRYGVRPGENDTSLAGCMSLPFCAALLINEAAEAAGKEPAFTFDDATFAGVRAWIEKMTDPESGRVGYIQRGTGPARPADLVDKFPPDKSESMTAIAMVLRQRLPGGDADHDADAIRRCAQLLKGVTPVWAPGPGPEQGNVDLYYWYYGALAMQRLGGDAGTAWMKALIEALITGQRKEGDVCAYRGSWDAADPWGSDGGRTYSTAMAMLCLETPHRYPRLAVGRPDLVAALESKDVPELTQAHLLGAVSTYRAGGAEKALIPYIRSKDPAVRIAGASAMARSRPTAIGVQMLASMLSDTEVLVRRAAIQALHDVGPDAAPAVAAVADALKDADPTVRATAASVLGGSGPAAQAAVDPLRALFADPDVGARVAAAGAVFRLAGDAAGTEPIFLAGLKAPEPRARAEAAHLLGTMGASPSRAAALKALLPDPVARVRIEVAAALWAYKDPEPRLVSYVEKCLTEPETDVRLRALKLFEAMGPDAVVAVPDIGKAALAGPRSIREQALRTLAAIGKPAIEAAPALYFCRDPRIPSLRAAADDALSRIAWTPNELLPILAKGLESTDDRWVRGSVAGFEVMGRGGVPVLLALLDKPDTPEANRIRAVAALGRIGTEADAAVVPLVKVLDAATNADLRYEAVTALGAIGPKAAGALDALLKRLDDVNPRVPPAAVRSIGRIAAGAPEAIGTLARIVNNTAKGKEALRIAAIEALGNLGPAAVPAIESLAGTFSDESRSVADAAVVALGKIGKAAIEILRKKLTVINSKVRGGAARALGAIGPESKVVLVELATVFDDPMSGAQADVAVAYLAIGKAAVKPLMVSLKHKSPNVRSAAARALGQFGKEASGASGALAALLKDPDSNVRGDAEWALDKVRGK